MEEFGDDFILIHNAVDKFVQGRVLSCFGDKCGGKRSVGGIVLGRAYRRMKSFYSKGGCWSRMGCVQLPHHGSKHNYNKDFDSEGICYAVSFGLGNRNHHPGKDVITNLLKNGRSVIFSTEANRYVHKNEIVQQVC